MPEPIDPQRQMIDYAEFVRRTDQIAKMKAGETIGESRLDSDRPPELKGESARWLESDLRWIHLGLAYVLIGIDRSLFELYQAGMGKTIDQKTVTTVRPIAAVFGADYGRTPWANLVQGIPDLYMEPFCAYLASFRLGRKYGDHMRMYRIEFHEVEIDDPVAELPVDGQTHKVRVTYALPVRIDGQQRALQLMSPGLRPGDPPTFGFVNRESPPAGGIILP